LSPPPIRRARPAAGGFGRVLARNGTRINVPDGAWPSLNGRFVCPGADAVYITDQPALAAP
jgi:hypothetical protein